MIWAIGAVICLLTPLLLAWGWAKYIQDPNRDWRLRASMAGLLAPVASLLIWLLMLLFHGSVPALVDRVFMQIGFWVPVVGGIIALSGRGRLLIAILPTCIAAAFFWVATTLP